MLYPDRTAHEPGVPPGETVPGAVNVLYVDYSIGFGGAIKSLSLTLRDLPGVEKRIITTQGRELVRTWFRGLAVWPFRRVMNYQTLGRARERVNRLPGAPLRWGVLKGMAAADWLVTLKNAVWLAAFIRRHRIDLLHLNNGFLPWEALLAARMTGVPCIVHLRDFQLDRGRVQPWVARVVSRVIAVSDAVGASLRGTPMPPERIVTVYDPVDVEEVDRAAPARDRVRAKHGIGEDEVAVGIFGRVIPWKGQREFVDAAIVAMRSDQHLRAVIVGDESDGSRDYFDGIRRTIDESGLAHRFVLAGYQESVEEYYAAMDVVVHASITPEPFGMVVPEGMAAGCAVIAADAGGPREVVTHGVDGLLVPPGDVAALSAAIVEVARDPARRRRMGEAARRTVMERFRIAHNAAAVRGVYEELLPAVGSGRLAREPAASSGAAGR